MRLATPSQFTGMPLTRLNEANISTKHYTLQSPNWRDVRPVGYLQA